MSASQPTLADEVAGVVRVGEVLADKYRVERVLGAGGMGVVVAATHIHLDERVAIKLMLPEAARQRQAAERFLREAKAAVKIQSEHVARVRDVGTLPNGTPYMVMEHLTGSDLAGVIEAGRLPPLAVVEYVLQACEALAEAHAAGIVHRDIKPANLFLTRRADGSPCVKVLDFGISKITTGANDPRMTKTSAVMGSPLYMSPEQLRSSRDVDARSDIWALGAVMHELLSGSPPFDGETIPELCMRIVEAPAPRITAERQDVPPALEAVILRCLEKDPAQRFQHVGELAEALAPFVSGRARMSAERVAGVARTTGLASRFSAAAGTPPSGTSAGAAMGAGPATGAGPVTDAGAGSAMGAGSVMGAGISRSTAASWSGPAPARRRASVVTAIVAALALIAGVAIALSALRARRKARLDARQRDVPALEQPAPAADPAPGALPVLPAGPAPSPSADAPPAAAATLPTAAPTATAAPISTSTRRPPPPRSTGGSDLFNDRK